MHSLKVQPVAAQKAGQQEHEAASQKAIINKTQR